MAARGKSGVSGEKTGDAFFEGIRWDLRDAAWVICLQAGLTALVVNSGTISAWVGTALEAAGAEGAREAMKAAGEAIRPFAAAIAAAAGGAVAAAAAGREFGVKASAFGVRRMEMPPGRFVVFAAAIATAYAAAGLVLFLAWPGVIGKLVPAGAMRELGLWPVAVGLCISAPAGEEVVYRGILYPALRRKLGVWGAVAVSAAVFAVFHNVIQWRLFVPVTQFAGGLVLAYAYEKTRSIFVPAALHACGNGMLIAAYFVT
ncbi:MAG: CPBP family intramembrane metalloprotease [Planctomycetes bacterium]|nr:CPBP family intramembrane metalloprotease [Planctomycetota bacterium]